MTRRISQKLKMSPDEQSAMEIFCASQTDARSRREGVSGYSAMHAIYCEMEKKVRKTIKELGVKKVKRVKP